MSALTTAGAKPAPPRKREATGGFDWFEDGPRFRPEIQALRTIAVLAVVAFHLAPGLVPGGFIGVDVFFVISGFLITSHLLRDASRTGRPVLTTFWMRRVRRLIPAAFVVLLATTLTTLIAVPDVLWRQFLSEIVASAVYIENWLLASSAVDYFAEDQGASPVQHYWSLSVEEQFYLVWPLLLTLVILAARGRAGRTQRSAVVGAISLIVVVSLAYSVLVRHEAYGYFSTFTHAWEFAAGALLGVFAASVSRFSSRWRWTGSLIAWAGYALIGWSIFAYSGQTPFPGAAALIPVAGTLAVIAAGTVEGRWGPDWLAARRPVQWVGDVSYSLYLWHWPPIVLVPIISGSPLGVPEKLAILIGSFLLAAVTKTFVEDRFRGGHSLSGRAKVRTAAALGAATVVVAAIGLTPLAALDAQDQRARAELVQLREGECFGAAAMLQAGCDGGHQVTERIGAPFARQDTPVRWAGVDYQDCREAAPGVPQCVWGPEDSETTVAVVGDSHVEHYLPAIAAIAEQRDWQVKLMWYAGCRAALPTYDDVVATFGDELQIEQSEACGAWKERVGGVAAGDPDVDVIVTTSGSRPMTDVVTDSASTSRIAEGFRGMWAQLAEGGAPVLVLRDGPLAPRSVPDCVASAGESTDPCALPREDVLPEDAIDVALAQPLPPGVTTADLNTTQCDDETCHFVVGGVITHYDRSHLSATFAETIAPYLASEIDRARGR
ncbi:acyltransferase family protein [Microbacterium sp. Marseille-Q6648]|uniref:acyltransferase family protein n=1 Tax=Microbacterium sp. Marseille-Q6648 TaxID=2937991 RepID=UPI00203FA3F7|nr:acyltransferase family protein [Microbacterium sp. Marseille-Q6648]